MKSAIHDRLFRAGASRRELLKTVSGLGAMAALGVLGTPLRSAFAQSDLRAAMLKVPGIGMGQPTDADWQKVGEMCLGPIKQVVKEGEFQGVELAFMGLNNQNLHNFLFRTMRVVGRQAQRIAGKGLPGNDEAGVPWHRRGDLRACSSSPNSPYPMRRSPRAASSIGSGARVRLPGRQGAAAQPDGHQQKTEPYPENRDGIIPKSGMDRARVIPIIGFGHPENRDGKRLFRPRRHPHYRDILTYHT